MRNIILIGFMGCGKSSVSQGLSARLGLEKIELDDAIEKKAGMRIAEIFKVRGETYFRRLETQILSESLLEGDRILSCGGGAVLMAENVEMMKKTGTIILLDATPETIFERVRHSQNRPLLNNNMNIEFIAALMEKRIDKYMAAADIIVKVDNLSIEQVTDKIIKALALEGI